MKKLAIILVLFGLFFMSGCSAQKNDSPEKAIRIAEQYGIAYAPVQIIKDQGLLEKNCPGIQVSWEQMTNTTAIREAMVADKLDAGFMAIPPFLIGWDNGMDWKIATGLSSVPVGLVAKDEIQSLQDIGSGDRIALPQPGSVQHILLAMACKKEFNDPRKMDNILVTLSHPDGMNALLAGREITAHFTSTPYLETELATAGYHEILDGHSAFGGDFSFIVGVTTKKLHDQNPQVYEAFNQSVAQAIQFINEHPNEAAEILAKYYDLSEADILTYITEEDTQYSTTVKGIKTFSDFMKETNYLEKTYGNIDDVIWENTNYEN
ncbi:ABC transporter substrate-binding protein [Acetobacterium woodii]|uniref:Nitrate/sulfonate/bicarbonate ABC transport system substrate binding protein SsuA2 n=1 Tax=Acetobacterium woodii (strain ATCC 29683 / DSM 1030 / JCM 2381 / KCTC 1655 / WB1) TaxID=931626 RepID=H6LC64_ACEWD|nr:ABC transporter substrate-binding protein [Acetobacterium woodii]AFA49012.1 nitrate/sulfonate/bicarbonate ABC transport system substrate binding protein SsuA2 [Acetobacterium woodii DSM 1030]